MTPVTDEARYPDFIELSPVSEPLRAIVQVPGSKSITNRALPLAALRHPFGCRLRHPLRSEDTDVMIDSLRRLGFEIDANPEELRISSRDPSRAIPNLEADLYVANSGTSMRFLSAMVSLQAGGQYRLDGVARMRERPIGDLLDALQQVGIEAISEANNGCPPVVIRSQGWRFDHLRVRGDVSSQFLSGLLMTAPFVGRPVTIEVEGELVSKPYITMTIATMSDFGLNCHADEQLSRFQIESASPPLTEEATYHIDPDASAASYFFAAAAVTGGTVTVSGLNRNSQQGDVAFVDALAQMGCRIETTTEAITVHGGPLRGIDIDMNAISDTVMTLAAVAIFAEGATTIRNVGHIRHKETDRIAATATELRKLGAQVKESDDGLTIHPLSEAEKRGGKRIEIATYNDHRMAMSFAVAGLRYPGLVILNPGCVAKTYPMFWDDWAKLIEARG